MKPNRRKPMPRPKQPMKRSELKRTGFLRNSQKPGTLGNALSGIQRKGGIRRVSKKRAKEDREDAPELEAFRESQERCAICWWPNGKPGYMRALQTHHLRKRNHRERNHRHNLQSLCARCHKVLHGGPHDFGDGSGLWPNLNDGHALTAQLEIVPDLDMELLYRIQPSKFEPTTLPDFYAKQRERNCRSW